MEFKNGAGQRLVFQCPPPLRSLPIHHHPAAAFLLSTPHTATRCVTSGIHNRAPSEMPFLVHHSPYSARSIRLVHDDEGGKRLRTHTTTQPHSHTATQPHILQRTHARTHTYVQAHARALMHTRTHAHPNSHSRTHTHIRKASSHKARAIAPPSHTKRQKATRHGDSTHLRRHRHLPHTSLGVRPHQRLPKAVKAGVQDWRRSRAPKRWGLLGERDQKPMEHSEEGEWGNRLRSHHSLAILGGGRAQQHGQRQAHTPLPPPQSTPARDQRQPGPQATV